MKFSALQLSLWLGQSFFWHSVPVYPFIMKIRNGTA